MGKPKIGAQGGWGKARKGPCPIMINALDLGVWQERSTRQRCRPIISGEEYFSHDLRGDKNDSFACIEFKSASECVLARQLVNRVVPGSDIVPSCQI